MAAAKEELTMRTVDWPRVVAAGSLWATVYNIIWGAAWFAFMRDEWIQATASAGRPMPWTVEVWFVWALLMLPIGIGIAAYAAGKQSAIRAALSTAMVLWIVLTVAMAIHALPEKVGLRIIILDSAVNLGALLAASFAAGWSAQTRTPAQLQS